MTDPIVGPVEFPWARWDLTSAYDHAVESDLGRQLLCVGLKRLLDSRPLALGRDPVDELCSVRDPLLGDAVHISPSVRAVSVWFGQKGVWRCLATSRPSVPMTRDFQDMLADAADRDVPVFQSSVAGNSGNPIRSIQSLDPAVPSSDRSAVKSQDLPNPPTLCVATRFQSPTSAARHLLWEIEPPALPLASFPWLSISSAVECLLGLRDQLLDSGQAASHLLALLEFTASWNRSKDTAALLRQIAETSTRWIPCERATIFLWDRANRQLVGRPALGVEEQDFRIPDDAGLVGQVIQSRRPGRVDMDVPVEQAQVDRRMDELLKFQTKTLLCVPLFDEQQECIGAFELINRASGNFNDHDLASLQLLARHAAIALHHFARVERLVQNQQTKTTEAAANVQLRGSSALMETLRESLTRVANTDLTVLLLGENGTGKEVAAQLLHYQSGRREDVLVAVNCAAIPDTLLESELFGHERGAFTDAVEARAGKFELASRGSIFLDEIGDMSLSGQAKLLRVLEDKTIVRVGGSQSIATQARVIAATNQNLAELVRQRLFREDLFFRLNVVTLEIPPLRLRGEDVIELAEYFLDGFCRSARRAPPRLSPATQRLLLAHPWPGNVRELRNMMERLAFLSSVDVIEPKDLSFISWSSLNASSTSSSSPSIDLSLSLADATRVFQADYIQQQIASAGGNVTAAAEQMGLHRANLYRKMKQLGIEID